MIIKYIIYFQLSNIFQCQTCLLYIEYNTVYRIIHCNNHFFFKYTAFNIFGRCICI